MNVTERRALIEERLALQGEIQFTPLSTELQVSEMTIRRDIDLFVSQGLAKRITGGAITRPGTGTAEPSFSVRMAEAAVEKIHLAGAVVKLLAPRETVLLDSGSTVLAVAKAIKGRGLGLTVITPSILVALELADEPDTTVVLAGGRVRPGELSLVGTETERTFTLYNCDTYVMGVAGVDATRGVSDYHREEGSVKKIAAEAANRVILVADHTKLGRVQLVNIMPLASIDVLVTDGELDNSTLLAASRVGVSIVTARGASDSESVTS